MIEQMMLTWHHLPELPEKEGDCLIAIGGAGGECAIEGRYEDNGSWSSARGCRLIGVYAWATWPVAPPMPVG